MSDPITQFQIVSRLYSNVCLNYKNDMLTGFFIMMDWWPWMIGFMFVGLLIEHAEVFYAMFAIALVADFYINWALRLGISGYITTSPEIYCTTQQQMPAYATDGIAFITLTLMILSSVGFNFGLRWYKIILISILGPIAIYTRVWLHLNTPQQLMAGLASGTVNFVVWSTAIYLVLTRFYPRIVHTSFLGSDYMDTLTDPYMPVFAYNTIPIQSKGKIKDQYMLENIIQYSILHNRIAALHDDDNAWVFSQQQDQHHVRKYLDDWAPVFNWVTYV
jgi:hypothetical protein